jgi:hypothetical protein
MGILNDLIIDSSCLVRFAFSYNLDLELVKQGNNLNSCHTNSHGAKAFVSTSGEVPRQERGCRAPSYPSLRTEPT